MSMADICVTQISLYRDKSWVRWLYQHVQLGARVSSGRGEELSDPEAERVYERGRCTSARLSESLCLREGRT